MNNNQNFSVEHVKSLLNSPLLQNQILHSLPASQAKALASLLHAESPLIQSIKQMSDNQFQYLSDQLQDAFTAPDRARKMCLEGKYREAIHCLHEAIDALARFPLPVDGPFQAACQYRSSSLLAIYHNLLSDCHWKLGDLSNAYQHEENAISFAQSISDWDTLAMLYHTQAIHRYLLGDYQQALSLCDTALETLKDQKDLWQLHKNILITISFISQELGQWDQAHIAAVEAVDLAEAAQDLKAFAQSLNCLACLNASTGENEPVDQLLSLALDAALDADDLPLSILILNNQAVETINRNESREDLDTALEDLNIAFYQAQKMDDPGLKAVTLKNLGAYYIELGQQDLARSHLEQALEILCQLGNRSQEIQVRVLLAKIAQQTNNFADAFCHLSDVIGTVEDIRLSLASESHRISYADEYAKPYDSLVSLLTQENRLDEAFLIAERARSQALRDLLLRQLAAAKQPSSGRLAGLQEAIRILQEMDILRQRLESSENPEDLTTRRLSGNPSLPQAERLAVQESLAEKNQDFQKCYSRIITHDPDAAGLVGTDIPPIAAFQDMLDPETLLLEFFQTDDGLYLFGLTHRGPVLAVTIPITFENGWTLVSELSEALQDPVDLDVRSHDYIRDIQQPLSELYDLLIRPIAEWLEPFKRVLIIPHRFWHYLPFHALWDSSTRQFLCDQKEIGYSPSAAVFQLCMARENRQGQASLVLVQETGDLPHAKEEARRVACAFTPAARVSSGTDAHLGQLAGHSWKVVHLICHGRFDPDQPFLSGLDLPPGADETRRSLLLDLFGLEMNANLVTLSACETGINQVSQADELVGFSRALFYAGAGSALLSLWPVADAATTDLMENFYWHHIQNHRTKTRALQLAMQAVKANAITQHPFFWAPFVLMGDWR